MFQNTLITYIAECIEELEQKRQKTSDFSTLCEAGLSPAAEEPGDSTNHKLSPKVDEVAGESDHTLTMESGQSQTPESSEDKSDVFEAQDEPRSIFADVFSEEEEEEEEEEDEKGEEEDGWVFDFINHNVVYSVCIRGCIYTIVNSISCINRL